MRHSWAQTFVSFVSGIFKCDVGDKTSSLAVTFWQLLAGPFWRKPVSDSRLAKGLRDSERGPSFESQFAVHSRLRPCVCHVVAMDCLVQLLRPREHLMGLSMCQCRVKLGT